MKLPEILAVVALATSSLGGRARAQEGEEAQGPPQPEYVQPTPEEIGQATPEQPAETPPQTQTIAPPPTQEGQPVAPVPTAPPGTPEGRWVFNTDYGWIWAPNGEVYTFNPSSGYPYTYVYEPSYGWSWIVAPWVFGGFWPWHYRPYTGPFLGRTGWYHGRWGWYHPWGWTHGYRAYYGEGWRSGVVAFRARYPNAGDWRGTRGSYRGGVYRPAVRAGVSRGGVVHGGGFRRGGAVRGVGFRGGGVRAAAHPAHRAAPHAHPHAPVRRGGGGHRR